MVKNVNVAVAWLIKDKDNFLLFKNEIFFGY